RERGGNFGQQFIIEPSAKRLPPLFSQLLNHFLLISNPQSQSKVQLKVEELGLKSTTLEEE
ncbi:hypothetical protein LINPERHAP1_LOCUS31531, partial [Linum perenne]